MKALTVHQPYAWAILAGLKRVENRTWSTGYRGPLLIHAGRRSEQWLAEIAKLRAAGVDVPDPDELVFGAIIGQVDVVDVVQYDPRQSQLVDPHGLADDFWATGPVCLILANPQIFPEPIPCRGQPGLWESGVES